MLGLFRPRVFGTMLILWLRVIVFIIVYGSSVRRFRVRASARGLSGLAPWFSRGGAPLLFADERAQREEKNKTKPAGCVSDSFNIHTDVY